MPKKKPARAGFVVFVCLILRRELLVCEMSYDYAVVIDFFLSWALYEVAGNKDEVRPARGHFTGKRLQTFGVVPEVPFLDVAECACEERAPRGFCRDVRIGEYSERERPCVPFFRDFLFFEVQSGMVWAAPVFRRVTCV